VRLGFRAAILGALARPGDAEVTGGASVVHDAVAATAALAACRPGTALADAAGPYSIVATTADRGVNGFANGPWAVAQAAVVFPPTAFPYWYPSRTRTRSGAPALHAGACWVVPKFVADLLAWAQSHDFQVLQSQCIRVLPTPPDADAMAAWLTARLIGVYGPATRRPHQVMDAAGLASAVLRLGWSQAARIVLALPDPQTPPSVATYLSALASPPSAPTR